MKVQKQTILLCLAACLCVAGAVQAGTVTYRTMILGDSPIIYYEFDETSGTTSLNLGSTGVGNVGTINGAIVLGSTTFAQGGTSYDFGGGWVGTPAVPFSGLTEWSAEAWVNWDSAKTSQSGVFGNDQGGWHNDVQMGIAPEGTGVSAASQFAIIQQGAPGSTRDQVSVPLTANAWHHIVATGSTINGELKLYVDGSLVGTDSPSANGMTLNGTGSGTGNIAVGGTRFGGTRPFDGLIDEFALYGTVLDATTVLNHFNVGTGGGAPPPPPPPPPPTAVSVGNIDPTWTVVTTTPAPFNFNNLGSNKGDVELHINGMDVPFLSGTTLASNRGHLPAAPGDNLLGVFSWGSTVGIAVMDTGPPNSSSEQNAAISAAFFPYADGWIGGHFTPAGTSFLPGGNTTGLTVSRPSTGVYRITGLPGPEEGLMFSMADENNTDNQAAARFTGGAWEIHRMDNNGSTLQNLDTSFLYVSHDAANVYTGYIDGSSTDALLNASDATVELGATITSPGTGIWNILIGDGTEINPTTAAVFLDPDFDRDNILSWEPFGDSFQVRSIDMPDQALVDADFRFLIIPFDTSGVAPTGAAAVPEPGSIAIWSLLVLCLAGYGRRRHRRGS